MDASAATPLRDLIANGENRIVAETCGLTYVDDASEGIRRRRFGKSFAYFDSEGRPIRDRGELRRIRALAVPPAYQDVWICPDPAGHIQATGRDERGRKQYRYHPRWRATRDATKYEHMLEFAEALPRLRQKIAEHMRLAGLKREKVLATIVDLLDKTLMRVGNRDYAKDNKSYGLTTLRDKHVSVAGSEVRFEFKGKSGKLWQVEIADKRVAQVVRACQDLPGQHLFQYLDETGSRQIVTSSDVNAYLREATGRDVTAKDFRTWGGTVLAAVALCELGPSTSLTGGKRNVGDAIKAVAACLRNTPTICRKCYVHPALVEAYLEGELALDLSQEDKVPAGEAALLRREERAVLAFLGRRLGDKPSHDGETRGSVRRNPAQAGRATPAAGGRPAWTHR
jgi:DNA topoisomerase-1